MDRRALIRTYRETPRPAGIYRVLHRPSGRTLLGSSPDAPAMLNRIRAQLCMKSHPNKQLQHDWETDGQDAFAFDVVDLLEATEDPDPDIRDDLHTLLELWHDKLQIPADSLY